MEDYQIKNKVLVWAAKLTEEVAQSAFRYLAGFAADPDARIRLKALENLPRITSPEMAGRKEIAQLLQQRINDREERLKIRIAAVKALGKLGLDEDLGRLAQDAEMPMEMRLAATDALVGWVERNEAQRNGAKPIEPALAPPHSGEGLGRGALRAIAEDDTQPWPLRFKATQGLARFGDETDSALLVQIAREREIESPEDRYALDLYQALEQTGGKHAVKFLARHLRELEHLKKDWRERRDEDNSPQATTTCERELTKHEEDLYWRLDSHEYHLGRALARLQGYGEVEKLLAHGLFHVRRGAIRALAEKHDPALLRELDETRRTTTDPIFRHAAYRAIDKGLKALETSSDAGIQKQLRDWRDSIRTPGLDAVQDRLEWTLGWVEYYTAKANLKESGPRAGRGVPQQEGSK